MTPLAPGAHPSPEEVDELLDLPGGEPGDAGGRAVASHVAGCARCQDVAASLAEVRRLLREEGRRTAPPPADLGDRLGAALRRAAAEREGTVVPLRREPPPARRQADLPRWAAVAAALVVLGGSAVAATQLMGGPDGAAETSVAGAADGAAESAPDAAAVAVRSTGTDYASADLPAQVTALLEAGDGLLAAEQHAGTAPEEETQDGDDAQGGDGAQGGDDAPGGDATPEAALPAPSSRLGEAAGLQACLDALGAGTVTPLAVDLATFEGAEAAVIVLPSPTADRAEVWVVDRDCRPGADGLLEYQVVTTP